MLRDRVWETTTTQGTSDLILLGARSGFMPFSLFGAGAQCKYEVFGDWGFERGIGTYQTGPARITRDTIVSTINGNTSRVNLPAGTHNVACTILAGSTPQLDELNTFAAPIQLAGNELRLSTDHQDKVVSTISGTTTITRKIAAYFNGVIRSAWSQIDTFVSFLINMDDAGATEGPELKIDRSSSSPAANDLIGRIVFTGRNSAASEFSYAKIRTQIDDATAGTEDGRLAFSIATNGTLSLVAQLLTNGLKMEAGKGVFTGGKTGTGPNTVGAELLDTGLVRGVVDGGAAAAFCRKTTSGTIVSLLLDGVEQGTISGSGTTISYNTFMGSHFSDFDGERPEGLRPGLVLEAVQGLYDHDYLPLVRIAQPGSRSVYGVYFTEDLDPDGARRIYSAGVGAWKILCKGEVQHGDNLYLSDEAGVACSRAPQMVNVTRNGESWTELERPIAWATQDSDGLEREVPCVLMCG